MEKGLCESPLFQAKQSSEGRGPFLSPGERPKLGAPQLLSAQPRFSSLFIVAAKGTDSGAGLPRLKSWLCHLLATSCMTLAKSPNLSGLVSSSVK